MESILILVFVVGYLSITLEHPLNLDKTVPALIMAAVMWALLAIGFRYEWFSIIDGHNQIFSFAQDEWIAEEGFNLTLLHHFGKTAEILIFLIGAMTIVELIDLHRGFEIFKTSIRTKSKRKLLWIVGFIAFFLSAMIDNLTTTIVLVTLLRKLIDNRNERLWYAGLVVIAANAGGAWSPIGDVTTTMLWIAEKVSAFGLVNHLVIPSLLCFLVPFTIASFLPVFNGNVTPADTKEFTKGKLLSSKTMLIVGLAAILSVPFFKAVTHLPPYMGMLFALGIVWLISEYIHPEEDFSKERKHLYSMHKALSRIEISSILFFLGILMAVAALESLVFGVVNGVEVGTLRYLAEFLQENIPNQDVVIVVLGIFSAVIDNVPLVAASMGMYTAPMDDPLWHFIAYSAGTGGSMLIIGSAAGVAAMGMEKIDFIWYLKKITWLAAIGFLSGAIAFILLKYLW
ncbi:MAG TPA: sodium:proton antiporter NhaD [Salinimicrobium sp.]|nr:sodium:proton antiporter NhaD [Salinimicrobium sp.]